MKYNNGEVVQTALSFTKEVAMTSGTKMLLGVAAGAVLLGITIPFAWADGGSACRGEAMCSAWLATACRATEA